jgi:environmental stress-induced protein Ves
VAFPGDIPVQALGTGGVPSEDFNVMTARELPRPEVTVEREGTRIEARGRLCLFALDPCRVEGHDLQRHDLFITTGAVTIEGPGAVIAVRLAD